jgi:tripartite-type tricarboxylate transporter receptor subunit TctC
MRRSRLNLSFLFLVMVVGLLASQNSSFGAEVYPQKPIQIIVPFPPGGPVDVGVRIYADQLTKTLKTPVIVVNKGGGGGAAGTNFVIGAKKDGYTLLGGSTASVVCMPITNPKEVLYDPLRDLEPIAYCMPTISCLVVRGEDSRFNTFQDLEKYVKANPGKLNMAVNGFNLPYYLYHLLKEQGLDMNLVVANGNPQTVSFLLGGHVDAIIHQAGLAYGQIKEGKMKGLVLFANSRLPDFANMPTVVERGYPKAALVFWVGFFAPKGTPQPILDVLIAAIREASKDPETTTKLTNLMFPIDFKGSAEFKALIEDQQKVIREIAVRAKLVQ